MDVRMEVMGLPHAHHKDNAQQHGSLLGKYGMQRAPAGRQAGG